MINFSNPACSYPLIKPKIILFVLATRNIRRHFKLFSVKDTLFQKLKFLRNKFVLKKIPF